jgi:hypothetical protein
MVNAIPYKSEVVFRGRPDLLNLFQLFLGGRWRPVEMDPGLLYEGDGCL